MRFALILLLLSLTACGRQDWQAVGYSDRFNPGAGQVVLGTYRTEDEARAAGIGYTKAHPGGDYIIGHVDQAGRLSDTKR